MGYKKFSWWTMLAPFIVLLFVVPHALAAAGARGVPVYERPRPDYDALGIRSGAFLVKPELKVGQEYNDNIYATKDNKTSDYITILAPKVDVRSQWSRHAFGLNAGFKGGFHASKSDENYMDGHILLDGRVDVLSESFLTLNAGFNRLHEERGAPDAQDAWKEPAVYYRTSAGMAYYHGIGKVSVRAGGSVDVYDYRSVDLVAGGKEDLNFRDRNHYKVNARVAYEMTPDVHPFLITEYNWRQYDKRGADRDSDGYRIGAGTGFDLGGITTGEVFGGYMKQDYDQRQNISGAWYGMSLLWNMTPLTSFEARIARSVKETTLQNSSGIKALDTGFRLDHELLRNVLAGAFFDYTRDSYEGRDITDKYYVYGPRVTYLWNRNLSAEAGYTRRVKDSNVSTREYTENRFMVAVTGKF